MTTELVTAHAGKNHIGSEDVGALYAGALGSGRFAFDVGEGLAVTMTDANTVRIGTGVFLMDGRQVRVKEAESVKVANGSQGAFRRDLVTYTYKRDPSNGNVEEGTWSVLQGTAAASEAEAKAPDYAAGNILDGDLTATVAVAEVSLSGLTPTARLLLPSVASLRTLGDSVSRVLARPGIKHDGTVTIPGLKGRAAVTVAFGCGAHGVMPTSDGTYVVAGAAGGGGFSVVTAYATASISSEQVTFKDIIYNRYVSSGLGSALTLGAGDAETIDAIYG